MLPTNFTVYGTAHVGLPFTSSYKLSTMLGPCKYGIASGYFTYVFASLDRELARWIWGYTPAQRLEILNRKVKHDDLTELKFKGRYDPVDGEGDIELWLRTSPAAPQRPKYGSWYCTFVFVDQRWATFGQSWFITRKQYFDGRIEWEEPERVYREHYSEVIVYLQDWLGVPKVGFVSRGRGAMVSAGQVYGADVGLDEASDDDQGWHMVKKQPPLDHGRRRPRSARSHWSLHTCTALKRLCSTPRPLSGLRHHFLLLQVSSST